jgi:hypothetical protein
MTIRKIDIRHFVFESIAETAFRRVSLIFRVAQLSRPRSLRAFSRSKRRIVSNETFAQQNIFGETCAFHDAIRYGQHMR